MFLSIMADNLRMLCIDLCRKKPQNKWDFFKARTHRGETRDCLPSHSEVHPLVQLPLFLQTLGTHAP